MRKLHVTLFFACILAVVLFVLWVLKSQHTEPSSIHQSIQVPKEQLRQESNPEQDAAFDSISSGEFQSPHSKSRASLPSSSPVPAVNSAPEQAQKNRGLDFTQFDTVESFFFAFIETLSEVERDELNAWAGEGELLYIENHDKYADYSLAALEELAASEDVLAKKSLAFQLVNGGDEKDANRSEALLLDLVAQGDISSMAVLSTLYQTRSSHALADKDPKRAAMMERQAQVWGVVMEIRGVPQMGRMDHLSLPAGQHAAIEAEAKALYASLAEARSAKGLGRFVNTTPNVVWELEQLMQAFLLRQIAP